MMPEIPAHFRGQPRDQIAKLRHDLTAICTADLRQEISDVGQQTTAVLCTEDIAKVLHRISEVSDGVLHGAELVH